MKTDIPRVDTALQDVDIPQPHWLINDLAGAHGASARREFPIATTARFRCPRGRYDPIAGSEILSNSYKLGVDNEHPPVHTAPQSVENCEGVTY